MRKRRKYFARGMSLSEKIETGTSEKNKVTGCIEWQRTTSEGYGQLCHNGKSQGVHRWVYEMTHGPIPKGMHVCHSCHNRKCCNPDHLFLGTPKENREHSQHDGRLARKFTPNDVRTVRKLRAEGFTYSEIEEKTGIYTQAAWYMVSKGWKHISGSA